MSPSTAPETTIFTIDPASLEPLAAPLSTALLKGLRDNNIELKLNVFDSAPDDDNKPVLVLIHGNSSSMRVFAEQINFFSNAYRVIAIDMLGHGQSSKPGMNKNIDEDLRNNICAAFYHPLAMMAEVTQCLKSMKIKQATFLGWSLGGHIAYGIAAANPALVHSIISIGSPPIMLSERGARQGFQDWFAATTIPLWVASPAQIDMNDARETAKIVGFEDKNDIEIFAEDAAHSDAMMRKYLFINLAKYNDKHDVHSPLNGELFVNETNIPLYITVGDHDVGMKIESFTNSNISLKHPRSRVSIIKNGTHAIFKTHAREFNQSITEWLQSVR